LIKGFFLALLWPACAFAQASLSLPGSSGPPSTCVQVQVAGQKPSPFNCLNQELQQQVQNVAPSTPSVPLGASSPSNAAGTFNQTGVAQQYGQNFGKSVIPYRPPPPVFSNPLRP
jgi:hypothetical protein